MKISKPKIQARVSAKPLQKRARTGERMPLADSLSLASRRSEPCWPLVGGIAGTTVGGVGGAFLAYKGATELGLSAGLAGAAVGTCLGIKAAVCLFSGDPSFTKEDRAFQRGILGFFGGGIGFGLGFGKLGSPEFAIIGALSGMFVGGMLGFGLASRLSGEH